MVAESFDDGGGAGVAHGEALAGHAVKIRFAAGGAIEDYVADQDVLFGQEGGIDLPSTTTKPLVMYSQPWSPSPSTTAVAPELRTAKRSPAMPLKYASPDRKSV